MDPLVEFVALIRTMRIAQNLSGGDRARVVDASGAIAARNLAAAYHERRMAAAGRAIVAASNAAGAGRVVEGRPVKIRACSVAGCGGWIDGAGWHIKIPRKGWQPTRLGGAWVWSTAANDPRPCAWPRPFARGADR